VNRPDTTTLDRWGPPAVLLVWWAGATLSRAAGLWLGVGGAAIALAAALLAVDGRRLLVLATGGRRAIAWGLLVGASMTVATYPLYALAAHLSAPLHDDVARLYAKLGPSGQEWRVLFLLPIVVAEEVVWRGFVQSAVQRRYGARRAVVLAPALYALAHVPVGSPLLVMLAFTCGLVWSGLRATTASLMAPLIAHLAWDLAVLFVAPVAR
jgi:membrane protease YdiL (CAAX protease family)